MSNSNNAMYIIIYVIALIKGSGRMDFELKSLPLFKITLNLKLFSAGQSPTAIK